MNPLSMLCSGALLLRLLDAYAVRYGEMLEGRSEQLPTSELAGGARIRHIFQDIFVEGVGQLNPSRYTYHDHDVLLCLGCMQVFALYKHFTTLARQQVPCS